MEADCLRQVSKGGSQQSGEEFWVQAATKFALFAHTDFAAVR